MSVCAIVAGYEADQQRYKESEAGTVLESADLQVRTDKPGRPFAKESFELRSLWQGYRHVWTNPEAVML